MQNVKWLNKSQLFLTLKTDNKTFKLSYSGYYWECRSTLLKSCWVNGGTLWSQLSNFVAKIMRSLFDVVKKYDAFLHSKFMDSISEPLYFAFFIIICKRKRMLIYTLNEERHHNFLTTSNKNDHCSWAKVK